MKKVVIFSSIIAVVLVVIGFISWKISYENSRIDLKTQYDAQIKANESNFDAMFKIIAQAAEISEQSADKIKETFKEVYFGIMEKRSGNEQNLMMKWITESNPNINAAEISSLYKRLMDIMEAKREEFDNNQKKLVSISQQYNALVGKFPGSFLCSDTTPINVLIVSSTKTKKVMATGIDDDVKLFKKEEPKCATPCDKPCDKK